MSARSQIEKKLVAKQQEIADLEIQIQAAKAYIQAMQEVLRLLPKDEPEGDNSEQLNLRHGSAVSLARDLLLKTGKPMHVTEILKGIGRENTKSQRVSLSGSLRTYARKNQIFTQEGGNLFGLTHWRPAASASPSASVSPSHKSPPPGFGLASEDEAA